MSIPTSPSVAPSLFYDDVDRAARFLETAFGFTRVFEIPEAGGGLAHAQLTLGPGKVMLGKAGPWLCRFSSPANLDALHAGVYVYVEDVDAHCDQARAAGARILVEPADMPWGDRMYSTLDHEGQFWMFARQLSGRGA